MVLLRDIELQHLLGEREDRPKVKEGGVAAWREGRRQAEDKEEGGDGRDEL